MNSRLPGATTEVNLRTIDDNAGPVFVVGMNGSGTTMMLDHLGQHPDLYAYPLETYMLPYYLDEQDRYGDLQKDGNFLNLWNDMCSSYAFRVRNAGAPLELPLDWADSERNPAGIFHTIMSGFAAKQGKRRWSEKTPMYVLHIAKLGEAFPNSRFIHMIRDGRDCAASNHRRWGRHPLATIHRWKHAIREGRRQGYSVGERYLEIHYEGATQEPGRYMRDACEFLGLEFNESVLTTSRPRVRITGHESETIVPNQRHVSTYFSKPRRKGLERIAGRRLAELGYITEYVRGDRSPGGISRVWWFVHDTCRVLARQIHLKFTTDKRVTWSLLFTRISMILKSRRTIRRDRSRS
jgi:Sulfotransferase family